MLSRITISLVMAAVLVAAPMYVSARTCILSDAAAQKAGQAACCANKTCCATSQKNTAPVSQPLTKSNSGFELNATYVATFNLIAPDDASVDRQLSALRARACTIAAPQLALLCTFRI